MTHETALRIIAEFMGWGYIKGYVFFEHYYKEGKKRKFESYHVNSFDTMRMVFDKWKEKALHNNDIDTLDHKFSIEYALCELTPFDCAARLAEAIEWWKTVKQ